MRSFSKQVRAVATIALIAAACRPIPTPSRPDKTSSEPSKAQVPGPAASMSHGEAPLGTPMTRPDRAADAPTPLAGHRLRLRMTTVHVHHQVAPGVVYDAWTFDSMVPGPIVRASVGDTVDFTLINGAPIPHSMDFHAAEIAPDRAYHNVLPKDSIHFQFVARVPGAFMYHCGTAPVAAHISNGMYGALIIDPRGGRPKAREFVFVQSEFYMGAPAGADSVHALDWDKVLNASPDYVVFNGVNNRYATTPIPVKAGEPLRIYVVNAGPNRISSFHVVGAIFDKVFADGFGRPFDGMQTWNVPVGGGAIFELRLAEPGVYPFVTHAFADATKGAVGMFRAEAR